MELKGQEGSLGCNPAIFRESSKTLDRDRLQQNPSSTIAQGILPNPDHFIGGSERIEHKSSGSSLKAALVPAPTSSTRYRDCLKNHAASVGGNVLDGCGEFMPSGEEGTLEALKCAACNCHRNFHRKEVGYSGAVDFARSSMVHPLQLPPPLAYPSLKQHQRISPGIVPPVKMAFGGGGFAGTDSSSEDLNINAFHSNAAPPPPFELSKKRFRTKFTREQKERMLEYAEKLGWRIPKEDDAEVKSFCAEVGVKREVLKVWMHNNKNSTMKQNQQES